MTVFVMIIHTLAALLLGVIILMQSGRGGGLTEMAGGAESMFGAHTNDFMIRATTVLASIFLITSLSLAVLSSKTGKSIMPQKVAAPVFPAKLPMDGSVPEVTDVSEDIINNPVTSKDTLPRDTGTLPDVEKGL